MCNIEKKRLPPEAVDVGAAKNLDLEHDSWFHLFFVSSERAASANVYFSANQKIYDQQLSVFFFHPAIDDILSVKEVEREDNGLLRENTADDG